MRALRLQSACIARRDPEPRRTHQEDRLLLADGGGIRRAVEVHRSTMAGGTFGQQLAFCRVEHKRRPPSKSSKLAPP
jgi:UDP-N-acetyl-D-mannosaminuronic acid transferase (WecB/TagA/CpsF family)